MYIQNSLYHKYPRTSSQSKVGISKEDILFQRLFVLYLTSCYVYVHVYDPRNETVKDFADVVAGAKERGRGGMPSGLRASVVWIDETKSIKRL